MGKVASLLKETAQEWMDDNAPRMSASLAYFTLFSLSPMLLVSVWVASAVLGQGQGAEIILRGIREVAGYETGETVLSLVNNARTQPAGLVTTLIGLLTTFFASSGLLQELQASLNQMWEAPPPKPQSLWCMIRQRLVAVALVIGVGGLLTASFVATSVLSGLGDQVQAYLPAPDFVLELWNNGLTLALLTLLFAFIYKFLPDVKIGWKDVWIGAVLTAILFSLGKIGIGMYLGRSGLSSVYGAASSVVALLFWIYFSSMIFFFGAEFTQVYARHHGSRSEPERPVPHPKAA